MSAPKMSFKPFETRERFYVERFEDGDKMRCQLVDAMCGMTLGMGSMKEANDTATFARAYVKKHGDIDLGSFPYEIDAPLSYDSMLDDRVWYLVDGKPVVGAEYSE